MFLRHVFSQFINEHCSFKNFALDFFEVVLVKYHFNFPFAVIECARFGTITLFISEDSSGKLQITVQEGTEEKRRASSEDKAG